MTDSDLIGQPFTLSRGGFDLIFDAEYENVKYFVRYYVKSAAVAEDIAQDTFESLWNMRKRINASINIRSYLFTIAKNKSLNYLGSLRTKKTIHLDNDEVSHAIKALNDNYTIKKIENLDTARIVNSVLAKLPDFTRKVFIMNRDEGMTYQEIAERLNVPVKKIEYNISKALKVFNKKLNFYY